MVLALRKNYPKADRIAPGVYRLDYDRYALRVVVWFKGQRVVDRTKEIRVVNQIEAIEERARWAAELKAPYQPTEVLDASGRVIFRDSPAFPPGFHLLIPLSLASVSRHHDCDCSQCLPCTY